MSDRSQLDEGVDEAITELTDDDLQAFMLITTTGSGTTHTWYAPEETWGDTQVPVAQMLLGGLVNSYSNMTGQSAKEVAAAAAYTADEYLPDDGFQVDREESTDE